MEKVIAMDEQGQTLIQNQMKLSDIDRSKEPTEPGTYWARDIALDIIGQVTLSHPYKVKVVEGIPNARGHHLLVATGRDRPRHRSLNCYAWGDPTPREQSSVESFRRMFSNQRVTAP